jgi:antitoxin (DNA-binding transcriptional repressor) of toxin-antitoxin stability system
VRTISLQELHDNTGAVLRDVEAGERTIITRDGQPVAELRPPGKPPVTAGEMNAFLRTLPPQDWREWRKDVDDAIDDPMDDPWERAANRKKPQA